MDEVQTVGANIWKRREIVSHYQKPPPRSDSHLPHISLVRTNHDHTSMHREWDTGNHFQVTRMYQVFEGKVVRSGHKGRIPKTAGAERHRQLQGNVSVIKEGNRHQNIRRVNRLLLFHK